jgi:hypothetical protein
LEGNIIVIYVDGIVVIPREKTYETSIHARKKGTW